MTDKKPLQIDVAEAKRKGLNSILETIEVKGILTVTQPDGTKRELRIESDADIGHAQKHPSGRD